MRSIATFALNHGWYCHFTLNSPWMKQIKHEYVSPIRQYYFYAILCMHVACVHNGMERHKITKTLLQQ